jgi:opacity protein-like surface antigen
MIRMRKTGLGLLLASFLVVCGLPTEAKGFYFGGSLGQSDAKDLNFAPIADDSILTGGTDGTDNGWKFFGGFKVFRFLNAELGYRDYGQASFLAMSDGSGSIFAAGPVEALSDTKAFSVSAMIVLPAGRFKFFGKAGAARWRTETSIQHSMGSVATRESDGVDAMLGVGAAYALKKSMGVRAEYERITTDVADRDFFSAGVHFRF